MKAFTLTAGRLLFALPFLMLGLAHFGSADQMTSMFPEWVPIPIFFVYLSGIALVAAGVSIVIKIYTRLATRLLALLLLLIILVIHLPATIGGDTMAMSQLFKDAGLMGGALYMSGHFSK